MSHNQDDTTPQPEGTAQAAYGNSRTPDGAMEQDMATGGIEGGEAFVGETSADPARRAQADADRPLDDD